MWIGVARLLTHTHTQARGALRRFHGSVERAADWLLAGGGGGGGGGGEPDGAAPAGREKMQSDGPELGLPAEAEAGWAEAEFGGAGGSGGGEEVARLQAALQARLVRNGRCTWAQSCRSVLLP